VKKEETRVHAWLARIGVFGISVAAFRLAYDAWTAVSKASGIRPELAWLMPWITEGFLALAVYTAWVVRRRGSSGRYPVTLAFLLLAAGVYVNVRHGMAHGHALVLRPEEAGAISALPTVITAASIHLLVLTFEKVKEITPEESAARPIIPDTADELMSGWASEPAVAEPMPEPEISKPEVASPSAGPFPGGDGAPALRGAGNFMAMAERATSAKTRAYWLTQAEKHGHPLS
jgi:hypothetical protein